MAKLPARESNMKQVIACIADSPQTGAVCDYAIWAARRLDTDLEFLHVLQHASEVMPVADLGSGIWIGAQDDLLQELTELDKRRDALAQAHGEQLLQAALQRARDQGLMRADQRQRWGTLVDTLLEIEADTRLFVLGRRRGGPPPLRLLADPRLEAAVRALRRPVLVAQSPYRAPERYMIAFDGSATASHMIEMVSRSPLLTGLECHLAMVGEAHAPALDEAARLLTQAGFSPQIARLTGEAVPALVSHARSVQADLLVMGAYGHSRIRQWVLGSTTTALLEQAPAPVLILR